MRVDATHEKSDNSLIESHASQDGSPRGKNPTNLPRFGRNRGVSEDDADGGKGSDAATRIRNRLQASGGKYSSAFAGPDGRVSDLIGEIIRQEETLRGAVPEIGDASEFSKLITEGTGGNEHDVARSENKKFMLKRVRSAEKWGRREWTPLDYVQSICLFNLIAPSVNIDILGVTPIANGGVSLVVKMPFVNGKHLSDSSTHEKLMDLGFEIYDDGSQTLDYIQHGCGIIIRDAHSRNFVTSKSGEFLPIDLQVELVDQAIGKDSRKLWGTLGKTVMTLPFLMAQILVSRCCSITGCLAWIRTMTNRSRICSATVTPRGSLSQLLWG